MKNIVQVPKYEKIMFHQPNLFHFDRHQFEAIVELITHLGWSYISSVHEEDNYGLNGLVQLRKLFEAKHKCLAIVQSIPEDNSDEKVQFVVFTESDVLLR